MPIEKLCGPEIHPLLAAARQSLGQDAVILLVRRLETEGGYELVVADAETAARNDVPRLHPGARPGLTGMMPARSRFHARQSSRPAMIALVGPTGAGKTTTIAKLATHPRVLGGTAVGILCLDTYRIGAIEQSRIYAEIARLPFAVVYEPRDVPAALRRLSGCETVLVDTAGRGPRHREDALATWEALRLLMPDEVHLTLPAGLQPRLARRFLAQHRGGQVTHLIATKIDEFPEDLGVFELALEQGLPMRWVTDGQEVPGDLQPASPALMTLSETLPTGNA